MYISIFFFTMADKDAGGSKPSVGVVNREFLVTSRGHTRGIITKLLDKVKSSLTTWSLIEINSSISKVDRIGLDLKKFNYEISVLLYEEQGDSDSFKKELESCDIYSDRVEECKALLFSMQAELVQLPRSTEAAVPNSISVKPNKLK